VDADDFAGLRAAINSKTRALYTEDAGQSQAGRRRHRESSPPLRTKTASPLDRRQYLGLPGPGCGPSSGVPTSSSTPRPSSSAATAPTLGGIIVDAGKFRLEGFGPLPRLRRSPIPPTTALSYTEAFGPLAFILKGPRAGAARYRRGPVAAQRLPPATGPWETLHLRMERHSQNALAVAQHLQSPPWR